MKLIVIAVIGIPWWWKVLHPDEWAKIKLWYRECEKILERELAEKLRVFAKTGIMPL